MHRVCPRLLHPQFAIVSLARVSDRIERQVLMERFNILLRGVEEQYFVNAGGNDPVGVTPERPDVRVADRAPCPAAELHVSEAGTGQGNRQRLPLRGRKRQVGEYVSRFAFHSIRLLVVKLGTWRALCRHQAPFPVPGLTIQALPPKLTKSSSSSKSAQALTSSRVLVNLATDSAKNCRVSGSLSGPRRSM